MELVYISKNHKNMQKTTFFALMLDLRIFFKFLIKSNKLNVKTNSIFESSLAGTGAELGKNRSLLMQQTVVVFQYGGPICAVQQCSVLTVMVVMKTLLSG